MTCSVVIDVMAQRVRCSVVVGVVLVLSASIASVSAQDAGAASDAGQVDSVTETALPPLPPEPPLPAQAPEPPRPALPPQPPPPPPSPPSHHNTQAITINPLMLGLGALTASFGVPGVVVAGRYHRSLNDRIALTIAPHFSYADILTFGHYAIGVKAGPRIAWKQRYLTGWFIFPNLMLGVGWSRVQGEQLSTALMLGAGFELGHTWHWWKHIVCEVGLGLFYGKSLADTAPGATANGYLFPVINWSVGYAW